MAQEIERPGEHGNPTPMSRPARIATGAIACVMAISPLVARELDDEDLRFQWRMFASIRHEVVYEVLSHDSWRQADLSGLSQWERANHRGASTLRALCEDHPSATSTRRRIADLVWEVQC
jgi:hypothetical protein